MCAFAAIPMGPRLPTLAVAEARSYPPYRGLLGIEPKQPNRRRRPRVPPVLPPPPTAAAAPAYRPRPRTPPNCKDPELQALAPPRSPAAPPFPTSITPSRVAFFNIRARA
eukprot:COSAG02_NODE_4364_length_5447_cov_19.656694_6_plen_110_part_00